MSTFTTGLDPQTLWLSGSQALSLSDSGSRRLSDLLQTLRLRDSISMRTYTIGLNSQIPRLSDSQIVRFTQIHGLSQNLQESPRLANSQIARFSEPQSTRFSDSQAPRLSDSQNPRFDKHACTQTDWTLKLSDCQILTLRLSDS